MDDDCNRDACHFKSLLSAGGLKQHVEGPTHKRDHTLDVAITRDTSKLIHSTAITDPGLCDRGGHLAGDHHAISLQVNMEKPRVERQRVTYRKFCNVDVQALKEDIVNSALLNDDSTESAEEKVNTYNTTLNRLADKHALQITKLVSKRPKCPWFNDDLHSLKLEKCKLERLWRRTELVVHHQMYRDKCVEYNKLLYYAKNGLLHQSHRRLWQGF